MSEQSPEPLDRSADRPEDVTDLLLWKLALGVADAHGPDEEGGCRNLGCAGQRWPCTPWNRAQRALQLARAGTGTAVGESPSLPGRTDNKHGLVGQSTGMVPPATPRSAPEDGAPTVVIPAA